MRLVLDTNAVISAAIGSSAPARLIELASDGEIDLYSSVELISELAEVLSRKDIAGRLARNNRTAAEVLALYEAVLKSVLPARLPPRTRMTAPLPPVRWPLRSISSSPATSTFATSHFE